MFVVDPAYPPARQEVYLQVAQPRALVLLRHAGVLTQSVRDYVTNELNLRCEVPSLAIQDDGQLLGGTWGDSTVWTVAHTHPFCLSDGLVSCRPMCLTRCQPTTASMSRWVRIASAPCRSPAVAQASPRVGACEMMMMMMASVHICYPRPGVRGRHFSLTHYYPWMGREFGISERDHFTMLSGIAHDPIQRDGNGDCLGAVLH
jgi:L-aminoadipate-semialdehyde dehydrogenase